MHAASRIGQWTGAVRSHPFSTDAALAATLCVVTLITSLPNARQHGWTLSGSVVLAAVAAYGAVLCRRRWPVATLAATVAPATVFITLSRTHGLVVTAPMIALYQFALLTSDRRRLLAAGGLAALVLAGVPDFVAHVSGSDGPWLDGSKLAVAAACGLAMAAGDATRNRRAYVAEVEERARRAEYSREQEARRRVTEERLRIARDLHDSIGHHIAVINAQAGMAGHVFEDHPGTARQALDHIRQASRAALDDLRGTIGLLRQPGEPTAPTKPAIGLCGLDELVASFRESGMQVDHQVDGSVRPVPPNVDVTAYRVVQEALTNVGKHAAVAAARVRLNFRPEALHIVVEDDGNSRDDLTSLSGRDRPGHGIIGMRERISAVRGTLDAGPLPGGGFRVRAVLPLPQG